MNESLMNERARRAPNFFLIGAPKCGTTSMAYYLSQHTDIFISHPKEPNFFNTDFSSRYRVVTDEKEYYDHCFKDSEGFKIRGECTVWYLSSSVALDKILGLYPDARFLVMLRDPVSLASSLHAQMLYGLNESIENFEEAWMAQSERAAGKRIPKQCQDPRLLQYESNCQLGTQLESCMQKIPPEQLHVVLFEDFASDVSDSVSSVFRFLGVDDRTDGISFEVQNSRKDNRSRIMSSLLKKASKLPVRGIKEKLGISQGKSIISTLRQLNSKPVEKKDLNPAFEAEIRASFKGEVEKLESLLGRDLSHWKKTEAHG